MSGPPEMKGLHDVVGVLARIQREAATGTLAAKDPDGGSLAFHSGRLTGVSSAGGAAASDQRGAARELLRAAAASKGVEFHPSTEGEPAGAGAGSLNAGDLILDLANAMADPGWVRSLVGGPDARLAPNPSPPALLPRLSLTPSEGFLLSRADGTLGLDEIAAISPLGEAETLRAVYGLVGAGLLAAPRVETVEGAPAGPAPPAGEGFPAAATPSPVQRKASALDEFLRRTAGSAAQASAGPSDSPAHAGTYASSPSAEEERARVEMRIAECRGADHFAVLGVEQTADEATIRRAYYKLAKIFHPDRYRGREYEEIFGDIESMFATTTEAYNTLTDETLRSEYERQLAERSGGARTPEIDHAAQARESYLRGRKHLEAEEYFDALRLLEIATQMDPGKADYWFHLGVVQTKNPRWRKRAEESLLKVVEMNPSHLQAYVQLARLYKSGHLQRRAIEMYEKILQWEPENEEALAALGRKKPKEGGPARGLRSLFKGPKS